MNICKYCNKYGVCKFMTKLGLICKHICFFIRAMLDVFFKERIILNITVIILFIITKIYLVKFIGIHTSLLYGTYLGILVSANLQVAADKYRKEILWDGDWKIIQNNEYNFEHKKDVYISLCGCLSDIIAMIVNYFNEPYRYGRIMSVNNFNDVSRIYRLRRFEEIHPNFDSIDEINSYQTFVQFVNSFLRVNEVIFSLQCIQTHLNIYCPSFNVKSTMGLLLNELFITSSKVKDLQIFIQNSSPADDALRWYFRLRELLEQKQINIDGLNNNIRNIIIHLSLLYNDINKDYDFDKQ